MSGSRFVIAGALLFAVLRLRGTTSPTTEEGRVALLPGALCIAATYGLIAWAELHVDSAIAALVVGSLPIWFAGWRMASTRRVPRGALAVGLLLGFAAMRVGLAEPSTPRRRRNGHRGAGGL